MSKLTKSVSDKWLFGVCSGIAKFFGIQPYIIRLIFVFSQISLVIYIILALCLEKDHDLYGRG